MFTPETNFPIRENWIFRLAASSNNSGNGLICRKDFQTNPSTNFNFSFKNCVKKSSKPRNTGKNTQASRDQVPTSATFFIFIFFLKTKFLPMANVATLLQQFSVLQKVFCTSFSRVQIKQPDITVQFRPFRLLYQRLKSYKLFHEKKTICTHTFPWNRFNKTNLRQPSSGRCR